MTIRSRNILLVSVLLAVVGAMTVADMGVVLSRRKQPKTPPGASSSPATAPAERAATPPTAAPSEPAPPATAYPWLPKRDAAQTIAARIPPPPGFARAATGEGSFARWLRFLPLKPGRPPVMLFDGRQKGNQTAHFAVVDMDVGRTDLQQCADTVIRLRAEYLYAAGRHDRISFHFTSGESAEYARWMQGYRPAVSGSAVRWARTGPAGDTYAGLRAYLEKVFTYAGTLSLAKELQAVPTAAGMQIGDVFIRGGSPGHVVIVVDQAVQAGTGRKVFMLAQGFMPAQELHVLRNPADTKLDPWYAVEAIAAPQPLQTPEYTFAPGSLRRFP